MRKYKYSFVRVLEWVLINAFLIGLIYFGYVEGEKWAENIFKFITWVIMFIYVATVFIDESKAKARDHGRSVPMQVNCIVKFGIALFLAAFGAFLYATLYVSLFFIGEVIHSTDDKKDKEGEL